MIKFLYQEEGKVVETEKVQKGRGLNASLEVRLTSKKVKLKKLSLIELTCLSTSSDDAFGPSTHSAVYSDIESCGEYLKADYALVNHTKYGAAHAAVAFFNK